MSGEARRQEEARGRCLGQDGACACACMGWQGGGSDEMALEEEGNGGSGFRW